MRLTALRTINALIVCSLMISSVVVGARPSQDQEPNPNPATRSFVYTLTNPNGPNAVAAYEANPETGELVFLATYPTGGLGTGRLVDSQGPLVTNPEGTLLFAANPGSDDISVMAIAADGSLELVNAPVRSRGVEPSSLALKDNLLYVANKGDAANPPTYSGFFVEPDGGLTRVRRRITLALGDNPTHIVFNSDGSMLMGMRFGSGGLDLFEVRSNGRLRFISELNNQRGPFAGVFNPLDDEQLIVADARLPGASTYRVTRVISSVTSVSNTPERAACWIVSHSDGRRVWVSNTGTNSLSLFSVDASGGLHLDGTHGTSAFGRTSFELALDSTGRFLYQLNVGSGNQSIHALRVTDDASDAGLVDIGPIALPPGGSPIGLAVATR